MQPIGTPPRFDQRSIGDARFPFGRAQLLAWNVVEQGSSDLSTFLCRSALGAYFLFCRPGSRPMQPPCIVPLSQARAAAWFDAHPVHFADPDALKGVGSAPWSTEYRPGPRLIESSIVQREISVSGVRSKLSVLAADDGQSS